MVINNPDILNNWNRWYCPFFVQVQSNYLILQRVLQNYPYRIDIGFHYFLLAGAASVLLAGLTILYLSVKAALRNPLDSLRYE